MKHLKKLWFQPSEIGFIGAGPTKYSKARLHSMLE